MCLPPVRSNTVVARPTILILAKLRSPFSVKLGVPSSMKVRSDKYIPRYGIQGGSHLKTRIIRLGLKPNIYFFRPRKKIKAGCLPYFLRSGEEKFWLYKETRGLALQVPYGLKLKKCKLIKTFSIWGKILSPFTHMCVYVNPAVIHNLQPTIYSI